MRLACAPCSLQATKHPLTSLVVGRSDGGEEAADARDERRAVCGQRSACVAQVTSDDCGQSCLAPTPAAGGACWRCSQQGGPRDTGQPVGSIWRRRTVRGAPEHTAGEPGCETVDACALRGSAARTGDPPPQRCRRLAAPSAAVKGCAPPHCDRAGAAEAARRGAPRAGGAPRWR